HGEVDTTRDTIEAPPVTANMWLGRTSGLGSLDASRSTTGVVFQDPDNTVASGLLTAQLLLWDPTVFALPWTPLTWYTSPAYLAQWYGSNWQGSNWQGSNWQGSNWQGSNWQGSNWQGSTWYGAWHSPS